jgi:AraC-like DNA-binding protein
MEAVASVPLLFHDRRATLDLDPQVLAARLAQHYPLVDFGPRRGFEKSFMHRTSTARVGDLLLSCGYITPIQGAVAENQGVAAINICYAGTASYQVERQVLQINPQRPLFFSPGQDYCYTVDHLNGTAFHADLGRLRATAAAMAGIGVSERRFASDLNCARALSLNGGRTAGLLRLLSQQFALLDDPAVEGNVCLDYLQIDDLIYRTLALLLCPRLYALLEADGASPGVGAPSRQRILDDLLEWLDANLCRPINLTELEQRSGYSRRNLQLLFHQRFGCGPIQWVRQQRLERARQALLQPLPSDSVATVAARFGFSSLAVFSRDFRARFGLRASELLREGRRRHG